MNTRVFITRQPVLDRQRTVAANRLRVHATDAAAARDMLDQLAEDWPAERSLLVALPGSPEATLQSWNLPPNTVLEVPAAALADARPALEALAAAGRALCLAGYVPGMNLAGAPAFRFLLTDATEVTRVSGAPGLVAATRLADAQAYDAALASGYDFGAGWFFLKARPVARRLIPAQAQIVRLLNLVRNNAEIRDIEAVLKHDVALSVKLLRYINSAGFGLQCEIQSFRHAVTILGFHKLHKWLSLLLVTSSKDPAAPALMQASVARGRFMELMGRAFLDPSELDNLFLTGAFSLLEVLLGTPLAAVLEEMPLPEPVGDALLRDAGIYADFLRLALACEHDDAAALAAGADALGVSDLDVNRAHLQALAFADSLQFK